MNSSLKQKKCRTCGDKFQPWSSTQVACSWQCASKLAEEKRKKENRKWVKEQKEKLKTRSDHMKDCQKVFNSYVRLRDEFEPCISCGRFHKGQYHAGHYRSVGSNPGLRFHWANAWKQCAPCNNHLSGNVVEYRIRLINKIGERMLAYLEQDHPAQKWSVDDILEIKQYYKEQIAEIKRARIT